MHARFGRYEIVDRIGVNAAVEVLRARSSTAAAAGVNRIVTVKRLLPSLTSDAEMVHRFLEGARRAASLSHASIEYVLECGTVEQTPYLVAEYVNGMNMQAILGRLKGSQRMPLPLVLHLACELCNALSHAHSHTSPAGTLIPVYHLGISPPTILVSYEGAVKLTDFGFAATLRSASTEPAGGNAIRWRYLAPEQAAGGHGDARSDVFALGAILYHCLVNRPAFSSVGVKALLRLIRRGNPEPLRNIVPTVPATLERIVLRALATDPSGRYQSADELGQEIGHFAHESRLSFNGRQLARWMAICAPNAALRQGSLPETPREASVRAQVHVGLEVPLQRPPTTSSLDPLAVTVRLSSDDPDTLDTDEGIDNRPTDAREVDQALTSVMEPMPNGAQQTLPDEGGELFAAAQTLEWDDAPTILETPSQQEIKLAMRGAIDDLPTPQMPEGSVAALKVGVDDAPTPRVREPSASEMDEMGAGQLDLHRADTEPPSWARAAKMADVLDADERAQQHAATLHDLVGATEPGPPEEDEILQPKPDDGPNMEIVAVDRSRLPPGVLAAKPSTKHPTWLVAAAIFGLLFVLGTGSVALYVLLSS